MPDTVLAWLIVMLATQRMTSLFFEEIARPLRERLLRRSGPRVTYLLRCPWCVSIWCAAITLGLWATPYAKVLVGVLAVSAGGLNLDGLMRKPS